MAGRFGSRHHDIPRAEHVGHLQHIATAALVAQARHPLALHPQHGDHAAGSSAVGPALGSKLAPKLAGTFLHGPPADIHNPHGAVKIEGVGEYERRVFAERQTSRDRSAADESGVA